MYLAGEKIAPEVPAWTEFWNRAQPIVLALGLELDAGGYGDKDKEEK